ncbi:nuclear transport factor 2 family protein [Bordetella sp. LUAb4]|uniref:nuclear transport factor 2 family protein n=1 Tax=Bordetella sp. LUAb4 TaxID=2843195 RepID=UPI001E496119|nr:nuclear transport factor 2 family protein [Bordetella sp. LUAb4]
MHDPDPERKNAWPHALDTATVQACLATVHGFFDGLDMRDHARAQSFFTADGQWERGGATLTGPQRIGEALAQRPDTRRTFHAVCNPVLERLDENTVLVRFYLLAYDAMVRPVANQPTDQSIGQPPELPTPLQPAGIRRCEDRLRREQGAWRIERKSSTAHLPVPANT